MESDGEVMRLTELIEGLPIASASARRDSFETQVLGVTHDSRQVSPGDLFVAWKGERFDGSAFADEARKRGAVAVLSTEPLAGLSEIPTLVAEQPRDLLGALAARVYDHPDRCLRLTGVTGTNGKTTVTTLLTAMLEADGRSSARLGTLGYWLRGRRITSERTTPEASDLFRFLRGAQEEGALDVVMEVSSHALAQGRVSAARFDVGVFLNLSRDHLDYHDDLAAYFDAKATLFELLKDGGRAVINIDDEWGRRLLERAPGALTFGESADVRYELCRVGPAGISGRIATPRFETTFETALLGPYNAENVLAAVAAAEALAVSESAIRTALSGQAAVEGRMDAVEAGQPFPVLIDYAHTPAALRAALAAMRTVGDGQVVVVFGCGGGRDRGKRELMGRAVAELADYAILTSDNPRDEDPTSILAAVEVGLKSVAGFPYEVIEDRRAAIRRAIEHASEEWSVLIAGKGHEKHQIIGTKRLPFVDREEAVAAIEERFGQASSQ